MDDHETKPQRDSQRLQELFVSVTGESVVTDRQDQEALNKVLTRGESDSSSGE